MSEASEYQDVSKTRALEHACNHATCCIHLTQWQQHWQQAQQDIRVPTLSAAKTSQQCACDLCDLYVAFLPYIEFCATCTPQLYMCPNSDADPTAHGVSQDEASHDFKSSMLSGIGIINPISTPIHSCLYLLSRFCEVEIMFAAGMKQLTMSRAEYKELVVTD